MSSIIVFLYFYSWFYWTSNNSIGYCNISTVLLERILKITKTCKEKDGNQDRLSNQIILISINFYFRAEITLILVRLIIWISTSELMFSHWNKRMHSRPGCRVPQMQTPHGQNDWQTLVKTLPCPKLRLREVTTLILRTLSNRFLERLVINHVWWISSPIPITTISVAFLTLPLVCRMLRSDVKTLN